MRALTPAVLALLAALTFASTAQAQSVSLKAGWAHPSLQGSQLRGLSARNTFVGGVGVSASVSRVFALEMDGFYAPKGAWASDGTLKISYVEVPVLAKVMLPLQGWRVRPALFAGPYLALKTGCTIAGYPTPSSPSSDCDSPQAGWPLKRTDYGVTVGGSAAFPLAAGIQGQIEARYDRGLAVVEPTAGSDVRTRSFALLAGIAIPFGRDVRSGRR